MSTNAHNLSLNNSPTNNSGLRQDRDDGSPKNSPFAVVNQSPIPPGSLDKSVSNESPNKNGNKDDNNKAGVGTVLVGPIIFIIVVLCFISWWKNRRNQKYHSGGYHSLRKGGTMTYEELTYATGEFAAENIIGHGGFGLVYKGTRPNGEKVAVKCLKADSDQGDSEFQTEIDIISRVYHRHLVSLVGYCIYGEQRMLVYEFISNKTLDYHLHGKDNSVMDWPTRMQIAVGIAKGLAYLHHDCSPRIIHRDVKSSNVLIDEAFNAKVSDFGFAKLANDNSTHVSTRVIGTFGYMAPEYTSSGQLTEKSDVYSFGVILLELITGKHPLNSTNDTGKPFVEWARPLLSRGLEKNGSFRELVDPFLEDKYDSQEMTKMAFCAASSIRHSANKRPTMSQIVRALEGNMSLEDLEKGMMKSSGGSLDAIQYMFDKFKSLTMSSQKSGDRSQLSSKELGHRQKSEV